MTTAELISKFDQKVRPIASFLPPFLFIGIYSYGRKLFLRRLTKEEPKAIKIPASYSIKLWDIDFASPLFNSAGMFKTGEGYYTVALQGAGAYLAGTTTSSQRRGNRKKAIIHPFVPLPYSHSAINWMGLPNPGNCFVAKKLSLLQKIRGCPIGASISASPDLDEKDALTGVVEGMSLYSKANVDFIELNESCPNVDLHHSNLNSDDGNLIKRLEFISDNFLKKRIRNLPVIVKFSVDTDLKVLYSLIDALIDLGFDGINLGNTSTNYQFYLDEIYKKERKIYTYFYKNFGGGISGKPLKERSLQICSTAVQYIKTKTLKKEFHTIRTGGIETIEDILLSKMNGIPINQWFTGYFESFSNYGHQLYKELFN